MAFRKLSDEKKLIQRMTKNRFVEGLGALLVEEELRASSVIDLVHGIIESKHPDSWDVLASCVMQDIPADRLELLVRGLEGTHGQGPMRVMEAILSHPSSSARVAGVRYLENHTSSQAMALLLRASRDPKPSVARMSARILLRAVENDPMVLAEVRQATADGIIELLDVHWAMELIAEDYPEHLRYVACRRLGVLGGEEATVVLVSLVEALHGKLLEVAWRSLETCPGVDSHHMIPLLASANPEVRARALSVYARHCDSNAEGLLAGMAKDPYPDVRLASLKALFHLLKYDGVDYYLEAASDENEEVRILGTTLLSKCDDLAPEMLEIMEQNKGEVRRIAITYLANHGITTPGLVMVYMEFLLKGSTVTDLKDTGYLNGLTAAAKALGQNQVPEALLALCALARSVVRRLRRIAMEAIMLYDPEDRGDALYSLQDTYDTDLLKHVAFGLHESGDRRAFIPLIRTMMECRGRPSHQAKTALLEMDRSSDLDSLLSLLKEKWPSVRRFGANRLKELKDPRSTEPLLESSRDDDVEVQLAVFEALSPFASDNQEVIERMLEAIDFGDISVRQAACEALGEARCKGAVPGLIKALHNNFLRPRATEALKRIGDRKGYLALKRLERREKLFKKKPDSAYKKVGT